MQQTNIKIKLVVFSIISEELVIFLPNNLLPSESIEQKISLDKQVEELFFKTFSFKLDKNYIEQLYTISNDKDEIHIVYYILLSDKFADTKHWLSSKKITKNIFDYNIILYALQRLQWKIEYTNVVYSLLPEEFTLSELQKTYESILGQVLDKRNFRKKILALRFLKATGKKQVKGARPAQIYSFKKREPAITKIFS